MDYSAKKASMKFNIKNTIGITAFLISQAVAAQFYAGLQSGVGDIQSDVKGVQASNRLGAAIKAGYVYSITHHIGIGTGLEFSQYRQQVTVRQPSATLSNFEIDPSGSAFLYNLTADNYKENQTLHAVQIPLFLQYKTTINTGTDFNFRVGAKYFLPVSYKIKSSADFVAGTAYYPDVNLYINDLPEYGFGTQSNYGATGEYQTKGIVMSTFEIGFTFNVGTKGALYAAMFMDYGYGSILDADNDESFIGYNPTSASERSSNGLYSTDKDAQIKPVAFGLTLEWNFK